MYLQLALPTPLRRLFDYLPPQDIDCTALIPGIRISVPFQARTLVGILMGVTKNSSVPYGKLKSALFIMDESPILPPDVYQLCEWAAAYYHAPLGEVLSAALPVLLRKPEPVDLAAKPKATKKKIAVEAPVPAVPPVLNPAQQEAVDAISAAQAAYKVFLLDGVTGSGKTEVYLRVMESVLNAGKQVLVLVPEISLTPQTVDRFRARFPLPMAALHSSLSDKQRLQAWLGARSGEIRIVIGTRSAIFTPFAQLGLIIVDEEHDSSFKQQDRFRYHARDLAILRAKRNNIPVVLGSATPSLESLHNARRERYDYLSLPVRAGAASMPRFELLDLRKRNTEEGLSAELLQAMRAHLEQGQQVMLFLNRRGFAPVLYCPECTWMATCSRCDARLVHHRTPPRLHCHHCDARSTVPVQCPQCKAEGLQSVGVGTQRLEQVLTKHFPDVPVLRVDRDSTSRKGSMQALLDQINSQQKAILLGTQMLAKGHHFPQVTLVGVVDADSGLFSADFRAAEQMGQLLLQVSGRAGREEKAGTVVVQTRHPDHPLLQTLIHQGYGAFSAMLLAEREKSQLPPFTYLALFRAEAYSQEAAVTFLNALREMLAGEGKEVSLLGPVPAVMAKRKGLHCQHLLLKAGKRSVLQQLLEAALPKIEKMPLQKTVKWVLDVDPVEV